jgi:hypothetical protein
MYDRVALLLADLCAAIGQIILLAPAGQQQELCDHLMYQVSDMVHTIRKLHEADEKGTPN